MTGLGFSRLPAAELAALEAEDPAVKAGVEGYRIVTYRFPMGAIAFPSESGRGG